MTRQPRFEICRGDDGWWWARFRAANGRIVWMTETYERRRAAVAAVNQILAFIPLYNMDRFEVREVDER